MQLRDGLDELNNCPETYQCETDKLPGYMSKGCASEYRESSKRQSMLSLIIRYDHRGVRRPGKDKSHNDRQ